MLRRLFYTIESQMECQKRQAQEDLFNRLMISDFKNQCDRRHIKKWGKIRIDWETKF